MKQIYTSVILFTFILSFSVLGAFHSKAQTTFYSYQSGPWNKDSTWTQDPAGLVIDNPGVPKNGDRIVILINRTVRLTANVATTNHAITVENGGTLDFSIYTFTSQITTLNGDGRIRFNQSYFPSVATNNFISPTGGTVEYYDFTGTLPANQRTYRNLLLTNNSPDNDYVLTLANPDALTTYTLNGNLRLRSFQGRELTFTLGNTAENVINLNIGSAANNITGNVRIGLNTLLNVGNYTFTPAAGAIDKTHQITINGNLENNGRVDLTNAQQYKAASNGAATVVFTGASDNAITSPDPSADPNRRQLDFYRLVVNKGTDQTFILDVNPLNFSLWAPTQPANGSVANPYSTLNPEIRKALWIRSGTLKLGSNIIIPKLADAEDIDNDGDTDESGHDFFIPLNGALWIDGATVAVTDPLEVGETIGNSASNTTMTIIGKFRITAGNFNGNKGAGFIYRNTGEILIEGGSVNISQFRISVDKSTANRSSYVQTGGEFTVRGNATMPAEIQSSYALFSILDPASTFQMSGGVLTVMDNANNSGGLFNTNPDYDNENVNGLYIKSAIANTNVTGGTVNIILNSNDECRVLTTAPLQDVNISRLNNTGTTLVSLLGAFTVRNNLVLQNTSLNARYLIPNSNPEAYRHSDLTVGGNFTINTGSVYQAGFNNTMLNGSSSQSVVLNNTSPVLYNLVVQTKGTVTFSGNNPTVQNKVTIEKESSLNDGGLTFTLNGAAGSGISNSGIHTGTGRLVLAGSAIQTISGIDGIFTNLTINNASGVAMSANHTVNGELRLANGILDISIYKLTIGPDARIYDAVSGTGTVFSNIKMIRTAGNRSDEGVSAVYDPVKRTQFTFPVGVRDNTASVNIYSPATIQAATTGNYGAIAVRPVNREHPNVSNNGQSLKYYWRVNRSGWTGVITATHKNYTYTTATPDLRQGTLTAYRAARFDQNTSSWKYAPATFNASSSAITLVPDFNTNTFIPSPNIGSVIDGEFTAGDQAAFGGITVYYSFKNGDWTALDTWSTTGHTGLQTLPSGKPGLNAVVKINNRHTITITTVGGERSGSLFIGPNSTLDLTTTRGNDFGTLVGEEAVGGTGTLRISSVAGETTAQFPAGDFGEFIGSNGGTVEYYTTADDFTLPVSYNDNGSGVVVSKPLNRYKNLVLNPGASKNITMADLNLTIFNDLTVGSASGFSGTAKCSNAVNGDIVVKNNLVVNYGMLQFTGLGTTNRAVTIDKNISIGTNGSFVTEDAGTRVHTLTIGGSLVNNNIFDMHPGNSSVADVTFTGETDAEISGTGATTDFNRLIVNKGTSQNPVLDVKNTSFTFRSGNGLPDGPSPLILNKGTFRLTSNITITISANTAAANSFTIQENARLSANGGTINIAQAASDNADLILAGKLEILSGAVNIGNQTNNTNNDIEYAAAAQPEIDVKGGMLSVNGQIRRSTGSELGILLYSQSGGQVVIHGRNYLPGRAKLEIEGPNSSFNMSDGTLTIVRGGGTTYGDVYLRPGITTVTGGKLVLAPGNATSQVYRIDAGISLFDLEINGSAGNIATAQLLVSPLVLKGNLSILNTSSTLVANNLNVSVGGNFLNAGAYTAGVNTTIFNGNKAQTATFNAATTFNNLTIDKPVTAVANDNVITFESTTVTRYNPTVSNNLYINNGVLENGERTITVQGDIYNNATHRSTGTGRILMASPVAFSRIIYGTGSFGRLQINDGSNVVVQGTITINTELHLSNGLLNIEDKLLSLGPVAVVTGNVASRYIRTNGVLSDRGVRKLYTPGSGNFAEFIWPIGSPSGYTPAQISGNAVRAAGASITVKPVDAKHPATRSSLNTELVYFWSVSSTGFSNVTNARHQYSYLQTMVQEYPMPTPTITEANYIPGRYDQEGFWLYGTTTNMSAANNTIGRGTATPDQGIPGNTFTTSGFTRPGSPATTNITHYIDGDYTAGALPEFGIVPTYYSRNATAGTNPTGVNWSDNTAWSTDPVLKHNGNPIVAGEIPIGAPVIIAPGHKINAILSNRYAASLDLGTNAILNLGNQPGHNLGEVKGTGTIQVYATSGGSLIFPGGDYKDFVKADGGTFEYFSETTAALLPQNDFYRYNHVLFRGAGRKIMAPADMDIKGNWHAVGGSTDFPEEGKETVTFSGTNQQISVNTPVNYNGVNTNGVIFNGLAIAGGGNKNLTEGNIFINRELTLNNGYIIAATDPVEQHVVTIADTAVIRGGSFGSYVSGPVAHIGIKGNKFFPVGKSNFYRPLILNMGSGNRPVIQAELINSSPKAAGGMPDNPDLYASQGADGNPEKLVVLSDLRYWHIQKTNNGTVGNITGVFSYDPASDVAPVPGELRLSKSPVLAGIYESISVGRGADAGSPFNGLSAITSDQFNSFSFFALASTTPANPLPVRLLYIKGKQVNKTVLLDWATASEINNDYFEVERSADGKNFEYIGKVAGKGTVQQIHKYTYSDTQLPNVSVLYYRLRQVDTDGKSEYSEIIAVQIVYQSNELANRWSVYPNPLRGNELEITATDASLKTGEAYTFHLYHISGKLVTVQTATIDVAVKALRQALMSASAGLYILQINSSRGKDIFKLLKQ